MGAGRSRARAGVASNASGQSIESLVPLLLSAEERLTDLLYEVLLHVADSRTPSARTGHTTPSSTLDVEVDTLLARLASVYDTISSASLGGARVNVQFHETLIQELWVGLHFTYPTNVGRSDIRRPAARDGHLACTLLGNVEQQILLIVEQVVLYSVALKRHVADVLVLPRRHAPTAEPPDATDPSDFWIELNTQLLHASNDLLPIGPCLPHAYRVRMLEYLRDILNHLLLLEQHQQQPPPPASIQRRHASASAFSHRSYSRRSSTSAASSRSSGPTSPRSFGIVTRAAREVISTDQLPSGESARNDKEPPADVTRTP